MEYYFVGVFTIVKIQSCRLRGVIRLCIVQRLSTPEVTGDQVNQKSGFESNFNLFHSIDDTHQSLLTSVRHCFVASAVRMI